MLSLSWVCEWAASSAVSGDWLTRRTIFHWIYSCPELALIMETGEKIWPFFVPSAAEKQTPLSSFVWLLSPIMLPVFHYAPSCTSACIHSCIGWVIEWTNQSSQQQTMPFYSSMSCLIEYNDIGKRAIQQMERFTQKITAGESWKTVFMSSTNNTLNPVCDNKEPHSATRFTVVPFCSHRRGVRSPACPTIKSPR